MGYQVSEQTRLRQITAEVFVKEGLDRAINLDRESFNFAHPHYQFITKWLHSALRQLTNRHKGIGSEIRQQRLASQGKQTRQNLDRIVEQRLKDRGIEDIADVRLVEGKNAQETSALRESGVIALRRSAAVPPSAQQRMTAVERERLAVIEQKAIAITQILHSWGLLEGISYSDQERLVRDILEVALAETLQ